MNEQADWSSLQLFLVLAEAGSLGRAVGLLGQSQATLSRQLASLEERLGQVLFERHARGLRLTAAGQHLLPSARRMREAAQDFAMSLAAREQSLAGTVRLTASEVFCAHFLLPALRELRERHPEIQVELVASNEIENLQERSADIALRMLRPEQATLVARKLADFPLGIYCHRSYLERSGMPMLSTMAEHQWLGFDRSNQLLRGFAQAGFQVSREYFGLRCDNQLVVWEAVRAGLGIGVGPDALAARDPDLVRVLREISIPPLPLWLTAHRELRDTPRLRLVFDHLAGAFAAPTMP